MAGLLHNKVAIITGGVSGIGLAAVRRFVDEGASVMVADIQDVAGAALCSQLGDRVSYRHTDVTDEGAVEALVTATSDRFGAVDIMFNNAGAMGDLSPFMELSREGFDSTLAILMTSVFLGHKYAARQFRKQGGGGAILTTGSVAGMQGGWSTLGYTTGKHAVAGIVRQAAAELAPFGIRSNIIAPGIILTSIQSKGFGLPPDRTEQYNDHLDRTLGTKHPMGRFGRPDDVAKAAVFLASDMAEFITGAVLPVDGGSSSITLENFLPEMTSITQEFLGDIIGRRGN
jgi:NAD(P)-dependent dehydrogenase (short-subunit alcohol dehydrogenase family)